MSALPGRRHRTMAPSTILREADLAAMEATNAALAAGTWALRADLIDPLSGRGAWGYLAAIPFSIREATDEDQIQRYPIVLYDRSILASVDVWAWQQTADAPIGLEVVRCYPTLDRIEVLGSSSLESKIQEYARITVGLINPTRGRPLGYRIGTDRDSFVEIRVTSGSNGDRISGVVAWHQRPPQ